MFVDPFIFVIAILIAVIGSNYGAPFSMKRAMVYLAAAILLVASFTVEYFKEQDRLIALAEQQEQMRIAEEQRKADEAKRLAEELKKQQEEDARLAAQRAEEERLRKIAEAEEAERKRVEEEKRAEEERIRKRNEAAQQAQQARLEAEKAELHQRRQRSFSSQVNSLRGGAYATYNSVADCVYYDVVNRGRAQYLAAGSIPEQRQFRISNFYRGSLQIKTIFFDDLEGNCRASLMSLSDNRYLYLGNLSYDDQRRIIDLRTPSYVANQAGSTVRQPQQAGTSKKEQRQQVIEGIIGGVIDGILKR